MACQSAIYLKNFITLLEKFLDQIQKLLPTDKEFAVIKNKFDIGKRISADEILYNFVQHLGEYKPQILEKDEAFFLEMDYSLKVKEINDTEVNFLEKISSLKSVWKELSENNKSAIWKYLQGLLLTADLYIKSKTCA